ncbi:MAG: GNAT family N-acetyltransferase [Bacteroidota bacterium]
MLTLKRTNSNDTDFQTLVRSLDEELRILDGDDHVFYGQLNKTDDIDCVVAFIDNKPVGCGAIREFSNESMEIKRMYTLKDLRGKGIASAIVAELEKWSDELGYTSCVLETGKRQPWAISLYKSLGYKEIPNYGKYAGVLNSVCFEKKLQ